MDKKSMKDFLFGLMCGIVIGIALVSAQSAAAQSDVIVNDESLRNIVAASLNDAVWSPSEECGTDGPRVQALYVREQDMPDDYLARVPLIRQALFDADKIILKSSYTTAGTPKRVRYFTDADCVPIIDNIVLRDGFLDEFRRSTSELITLGYLEPDRKYVMFTDSVIYCGIASISPDDSPDPNTNRNNTETSFARVDRECISGFVVAHELFHSFGAVQMSAPNSDRMWHCFDAFEVMCYGDHTRTVCPVAYQFFLDCNNDDYFHLSPALDSYLDTHWNAANSRFLYDEPWVTRLLVPIVMKNDDSDSEGIFRRKTQ